MAKGGFQVEELARMRYPNGIFIDTEPYEYERAAELTKVALEQENVVIYEAAFLIDDFFIRTDILVKQGNQIKLIEVKAKSYNPDDENTFIGKRGGILATWKPYLFDLAFQKVVAKMAYPSYQFEAFLMLADKTKKSQIDGMNQLFRVPENGNPRTAIIKKVNSIEEIGASVLTEENVDEIINDIIADKHKYYDSLGFLDAMESFKRSYQREEYYNWPTDFSTCKKCEFKTNEKQVDEGKLSGFEYCFKKQHTWSDLEFNKPNALEIWNYQGKGLMEDNRLLLVDLTEDDFKVKVEPNKISSSERQWIQVEKSRSNDLTPHIEKEGIKAQIDSWEFPLHFIDFETSTVALPFTANRRPYEQVAFQFSHHVYHKNGEIEHRTEFISNTPGEFPNFIFARALFKALGNDHGTIFRYAPHENTIINAIINQLKDSGEQDAAELIDFLKSITQSTKNSADKWKGDRAMVDLHTIVKDYYYNPYTKGSNSIKDVLPACLNSSSFLKAKYSQSISTINLSSKNFPDNHIWLEMEGDKVVNPYKMLPKLFENWTVEELDEMLSEIDGIADGGAALTAYAKLQYQDMSDKEREEITKGLLKYCELDTLAMVMLYEHMKEITD